MPSLTETTGLPLPELGTIEKFLIGCTVPLVYQSEERTGVLGTGAFFSLEGRPFLVTAGHLFRSADPNKIGVPERAGKDVAMWYLGHATIHHPKDTDEHDVAVIELLDQEFIQRARSGWNFLTEANVAVAEQVFENYIIAGYPDSTVIYEDGTLRPTALMQLYTAPYDGEVSGDRGEFDLFFRYGREAGNTHGQRKETPALGGASGALVYGIAEPSTGIWAPEGVLKVVGIQVSFVHSKYVRAKKWALLQHVLAIVQANRAAAKWADSRLKCNAGDVFDFEPGEDLVGCLEAEDLTRHVVQDEL
jgi:hypothetical protein